MRTSKLLAAFALGTTLLAGSALYLPVLAQTNTAENAVAQQGQGMKNQGQGMKNQDQGMKNQGQGMRNSGQPMQQSRKGNKMQNVDTTGWISIKEAYDKVDAAGYKDVHSIKRTPDGYVVKATNAEGNWTRLSVDPIKGDVNPIERKNNSGKKDKGNRNDRNRN